MLGFHPAYALKASVEGIDGLKVRKMLLSVLCLAVFLLFVLIVAGFVKHSVQLQIDDQRRAIDAAFLARIVRSEDPRLEFDPQSAMLIHDDESIRRKNGIVRLDSVRLYKNRAGYYFLFICTPGDKGCLKHLSEREARGMLVVHKDKYLSEFGSPIL